MKNEAKDDVVAELLERYHDQRVIVIGQYLSQLYRLPGPLRTSADYRQHRQRRSVRSCIVSSVPAEVRHLILSKVGNFAIDLPDANVLIQVSGTFGSRQEEAAFGSHLAAQEQRRRRRALLHAGVARHA